MAYSQTVATRVMIVSDTHEHCLHGSSVPQVDVLIHTGDLTNFGELNSLRAAVQMLSTVRAELKLVIAGNHDISLDSTRRVENMSDQEYQHYHEAALDIMTGPTADQAGIRYLQEGIHSFVLGNGASLTVYASPCTSGSGSWAFPYTTSEDRFNNVQQTQGIAVGQSPIPSTSIDIVMTHGPPHSILDQVDGTHLGYRHLLRAVGRARPLLHCFGHIPEGHGANIVTWKPDGSVQDPASATPLETEQVNEYPYDNE